MTIAPVRKAVFPVAGLGTRFLPATKSIPKEMLPIVDKPLIQYAVDESIAAGIETLIFVTSRKKHAISDHFDTAFELETKLANAGKIDLVQKLHDILPPHIPGPMCPSWKPWDWAMQSCVRVPLSAMNPSPWY